MSSITELIRQEIENLSTDSTRTNVGTVTTVADGVAKVDGLSKVMQRKIEFLNVRDCTNWKRIVELLLGDVAHWKGTAVLR